MGAALLGSEVEKDPEVEGKEISQESIPGPGIWHLCKEMKCLSNKQFPGMFM